MAYIPVYFCIGEIIVCKLRTWVWEYSIAAHLTLNNTPKPLQSRGRFKFWSWICNLHHAPLRSWIFWLFPGKGLRYLPSGCRESSLLVRISSWSAWAVSFQALGPLCSAGQSPGLPLGASALVVELSGWEEMLAVSQPIYYGDKSVMHHLREPLTHRILQVVLAETLDLGYRFWISSALSHLMRSGSSKCGKFLYHRIENLRKRSKRTELHFSLSPTNIFTKLGGWLLLLFRYKKLLDGSFFKI